MCTKWFSDGDVHKYFNPYDTPYDAFINYMNILSDFIIRLNNISRNDNHFVDKSESFGKAIKAKTKLAQQAAAKTEKSEKVEKPKKKAVATKAVKKTEPTKKAKK